jgi:Fur family zinc uptake transcriptional regulator
MHAKQPPEAAQHVDAQLDAAQLACARNGAQLTALRRAVLRLILAAPAPLTAYQLLDLLKETRKSAAPPTIYRALDFLIEQNLIHKVERLNAFIPCTEGGQPHEHTVQFFICRQCGTVAEIEDQAITEALAKAAGRQGFRPGNAVVEVDGTCAACALA